MNTVKSAMCAAAMGAALALPAGAGPAIDPAQRGMIDAAEVRAAIELQLEALGRDDFEEAFAYASPEIRARFMTAAKFAEMVRSGYPMVHRAMRSAFGAMIAEGGGLRQTVVLTDAAGRVWVADYHMALIDGLWCIDGVSLRPAQQAGA